MRRMVILLAMFLTRCDGVRTTLGLDHQGPNEFDSVPLSPLSLPQDFKKTPATETKEERKTDPKAFPFAFAEPDNASQDLPEKDGETPSVEASSSTEGQVLAQNILLGGPTEKGTNAGADCPSENVSVLQTKNAPKDLPPKSVDTPSVEKSVESKVEVQDEKSTILPLTRAVSRPILNSPREEEMPEETPTKWSDQEAVLNNSWLSVQEGTPLQEAELHILDSEVTNLGEVATDSTPTKRDLPQVSRLPRKKEFDVPATKKVSTISSDSNLSKRGVPTEPLSAQPVHENEKTSPRSRGMSPILRTADKKQVQKKPQRLSQSAPQPSLRQVSSPRLPTTHEIRHPDPTPPKTTMKPILPRRTKTRADGPKKMTRPQKRLPRRIVRRHVSNKAVPQHRPAVPGGVSAQQNQGAQ